jgi:hypothetical protein
MPQADPIMVLEPNEIFVFGSNTAGRHGRGAALQARLQWGAKWGVGEGFTGQCWAFPTLDGSDGQLTQLPIHSMEASRDLLYTACNQHPDKIFLLTKVGCGLAGYPEEMMRGLFVNPPPNLILPQDWQ